MNTVTHRTCCKRCLAPVALTMTEQEYKAITALHGLRPHRPVCEACLAELGVKSEVIDNGKPTTQEDT